MCVVNYPEFLTPCAEQGSHPAEPAENSLDLDESTLKLNKGTLNPGGNRSIQDTYFTSHTYCRYNITRMPGSQGGPRHMLCTIALIKKAPSFTPERF